MPKVSIVLPSYNGERFIRASIDSVLRQTFQDWELIIVDDCSKDSTGKIAEQSAEKDPRIKVIHNEVNKKLPESLNVGFRAASGEYLTWTSDDNLYLPDAIKEMVAFLDAHDAYPMVCADMVVIDEKDQFIKHWPAYDPIGMYCNDFIGACFMYRREVLHTVGEYDPLYFCIEDYEYWMRILKHYGYIGHIPKLLYRYREHGASLTVTKSDKVKACLEEFRFKNLDWLFENVRSSEKYTMQLYMELENTHGFDKALNQRFAEYAPFLKKEISVYSGQDVIAWGCGNFGRKAKSLLGDKIQYFVDSNPKRKGTEFEGKIVLAPEEIDNKRGDAVLLVAVSGTYVGEILQRLNQLGTEKFLTMPVLETSYQNP